MVGMASERVPASPCPECGAVLDGAEADDGGLPNQGDFSVCVYCGCMSRYGVGLQLVRATAADLDQLPDDVLDEINRTRAMILVWIHHGGHISRGGSA